MAAVLRAVRKESGQAVLFSQAVAERVGLAGTDIECLEVLQNEGRTTVGRLAELTGLTTGSATRMVDRLEQAGYVKRVGDPADRRRVLVEPVAGLGAKFGALHASIASAQVEVIERYSDDQLRLLVDFLDRSSEVARSETAKMRVPSEEAGAGGSYSAPVGGVTDGRLVFLSGAPRMSVRSDATLTELYKAKFAGPVPRMRVRGGVVTVAYPRFGWFDWRAQVAGQTIFASAHWRKDAGEIVLNAKVPWSIELRGGVSEWRADLRGLRLESFELRGGANKIELLLSRPTGVVPIRVTGGISRISIERPLGVACGLELRGGVSEVSIDGHRYKGAGRLSIQSPDASDAPDRYEIEVEGGASKVLVLAR
ncbi:MAG: MarR family winged helix-turn-helix transcriptional regulator [Candidatus Limnocylindrales bacterium]